jgi:Transglycosylase SLT domain
VGRTRTRRRLIAIGPGGGCILLLLLAAAPAVAQLPTVTQPTDGAAASDLSVCEQAGDQAERAHALPAGLLLAIGRVESGRWDASLGRVVPWPWAVDAAGDGTLLDSKQAAIARTAALRDGGTRNVDVGCYQINLASHPFAFTDLQQAFDPVANADYAARFLVELYARTGNWNDAVAAYHSAQPGLGTPYRQLVFANWPLAGHAAANTQAGVSPGSLPTSSPTPLPASLPGPLEVQFASGARMRIWTPSGAVAVAETLAITPLASALLPRVHTGTPGPR